MDKLTEDELMWGSDTFVYCKSHMRVHLTGWCTVPTRNKIKMTATSHEAANQEARDMGLPFFHDCCGRPHNY